MSTANKSVSITDFEQQFVSLSISLKSYLFRITANRYDAEDLMHDTYIKAKTNLAQFNGRSSLKTWVFSIATNLVRDHQRATKRWGVDGQDRTKTFIEENPDLMTKMRHIVTQSPAEAYEFKEHVDYCFTCLAKTLEIEQQLALILKDIYGFRIQEIIEITGLRLGQVKYALTKGRQLMQDIFDHRCAIINQQGVCYQCSEMQGYMNPKQQAQEANLRLLLDQDAKPNASKQHLYQVRTKLIKDIDPLQAPGHQIHAWLLEQVDKNHDTP